MNIRKAFATALKETRKAKCLTQEDFSEVSSRTYMSSLERALKSPTLDKVDEIASVLNVHPVTILIMAYTYVEKGESIESIFRKVSNEARNIKDKGKAP